MADSPPGAHAFPSPRTERIATSLLLALFVIVGVNLIGNDAFQGQDYPFHVRSAFRLLQDPGAWFAQDLTHRPLIYWIAAHGFRLTEGRAPFQFAAFVFLLLNTGALWLLYDCSRRFIRAPLVRLASLALIAFWPATTITTVVFAADTIAQPPFALLCWSVLRWKEAASDRAAAGFAALAGVALAIGNFGKYTFFLLPAGVVVLALLAWRWRHASPRRVLFLVLLGALAPAGCAAWLNNKALDALRDQPQHHRFNWAGTGEMTWRSLLGLKWSDARIFDAPGYWDAVTLDGKQELPLLWNNHYSYPALLHLGTFTDVLDFSHGGVLRRGRPRPEPQKTLSQWSVRLGVIFSVAGFVAVLLYTARTLRGLALPGRAPAFGAAIWLVLGLNWYVPLAFTLPFVHHAYDWGYWLPRLVLPALWGFGLCLFAAIDERIGERRHLAIALAAITAVQVLLQVGSVWY